MNFDLHIQNIGKLTDAKIRIGRFTVFAGPNNTGKSFASKTLYSIFEAMNVAYGGTHVKSQIENLLSWVSGLSVVTRDIKGGNELMSNLEKTVSGIRKSYEHASVPLTLKVNNTDKTISRLTLSINALKHLFSVTRSYIEDSYTKEDANSILPSFRYAADKIQNILSQLEESLDANKEAFIFSGIEHKIEENLILNFQVSNLSDLMTKEDLTSQVVIKDVGELKFINERISLTANLIQLSQLERFSNKIYLESPAYWKLKNALERGYVYPGGADKRVLLTGVPSYFHDLTDALKSEYTGNIAFPDVYKRLIGKKVLDGNIAISKSDNLSFQEHGRNFPLSVTALGVTNLGILALLIKRKVLDENALIFIDEPEAHLHPAWQVVMAKALFDLAKGGAHVVIATHSVDILKWLDVHIKKHPEDEKLVALNKFPVNGDEFLERDFDHKMAAIKGELTEPFADLYLAGL